MKIINVLVLCSAWFVVDVHAAGPDITAMMKRASKVKRYNLHDTLMSPTPEEVADGVENSRRLARNAVRLGIDEDHHRKLLADYDITKIKSLVHPFKNKNGISPDKPSKGPRLLIDEAMQDALPFGDGPGVFPGLPKATRAFWLEGGWPTEMWEVIACPVIDPEGYKAQPAKCAFGGTLRPIQITVGGRNLDDAEPETYEISDFFVDIGDDAVKNLFDNALVPTVKNTVKQVTGAKIFDEISDAVCGAVAEIEKTFKLNDALDTLVKIFAQDPLSGANGLNIHQFLGNFQSLFPTVNLVNGTATDIKNLLGFGSGRSIFDLLKDIDSNTKPPPPTPAPTPAPGRKLLEDSGPVDCSGHSIPCSSDDQVDCTKCDLEDDSECSSCGICYQPSQDGKGICVPKADFERYSILHELQKTALANYIESIADTKAIPILNKVLGANSDNAANLATLIMERSGQVEDTIIAHAKDHREHIEEGIMTIEDAIAATEQVLSTKIKDQQCPDPPSKPQEPKASFSESMKKEVIQNVSAKLKSTDTGTKVEDDVIEGVMEQLLDVFQQYNIETEKAQSWMKDDPAMSGLNDDVMKEFEAQRDTFDQYSVDIAADLIKRKLDAPQPASSYSTPKINVTAICEDTAAQITVFIETFIVNLVDNLISGAEELLKDLPSDRRLNEGSSFMNIVLVFFKVLDPMNENSFINPIYKSLQELINNLLKSFMFGCDYGAAGCPDLPSEGEVLTVSEARNGDLYLSTGCDSNFESELLYFVPVLNTLSTILTSLADIASTVEVGAAKGLLLTVGASGGLSVVVEGNGEGGIGDQNGIMTNLSLEIFAAPFVLINVLVEYIQGINNHMNDVCGLLDGWVELSKLEATFENTRYALRELACRGSTADSFNETLLKRGYGCDGIDNTCDPDKRIDECEEDIFPPDIVLASNPQECTNQHFQSEPEAISCITGIVSATDDCKPVKLDVEISEDAGTCSPVVKATAKAQGCGERPKEDVSEMDFRVIVDEEAPEVSCSIGNTDMTGNGQADFEDAEFQMSVMDSCSGSVDLKIEVLSNERDFKLDDMALIAMKAGQPIIYLRNAYCNKNGRNCMYPVPGNLKSREYAVTVTAVDKAGNVGVAHCNTFVGDDTSKGNAMFDLVSTEYTVDLAPLATST